jgi:V/A-type H+/Na+-transporting ATPase subunit K
MGYTIATIGLVLMVGFAGIGSAIGTSMVGCATLGMFKKKPEAFGTGMVLTAVPGSQGLYGFVAFFLYNQVVNKSLTPFQGAVVLAAGLVVGLVCLLSAIYQGKVCANGVMAIGQGHNAFVNTILLASFPELYAILSLVAAILMQGLMNA